MPIDALAAFWAVSMLLVLVPGADWAYAIAAGLGDRTILPAVSGLLAGYVVLTAVVAAGVAALVARSPLLLTALTVSGAAYLVWLGVTLLARPAAPLAAAQDDGRSWAGAAAKGVATSGLNPKGLLLFLAVLPQFVARDAGWPLCVQITVLGLVHTCNCAAVYLGVGTAARRVLRTRPSLALVVTRCSGAAIVMIGLLLVGAHLLAY